MNKLKQWLVISKQTQPSDFYVKTDDSDYYTAYWVAFAYRKEKAKKLVLETVKDLSLGKTELIELQPYTEDMKIHSREIMQRIRSHTKKQTKQEDVLLAAWVSSKGKLW